MSVFSARVADRFAAATETYDAHSTVQRHAATQLARLIAVAGLPPRPRVLELGCGTGHLTRQLRLHLPGARILATDIAPGMVEACRARMGTQDIDYAVMDACQPRQPGRAGLRRPASADCYDLICASFAAQWFDDLPRTLTGLSRRLSPGGMLALNLLGRETFREWRAAHAALGLRPGTPDYPDADRLHTLFPSNRALARRRECWIERPASGLAFLRDLRAIGADIPAPGHVPLSAADFRRVLRVLGPAPSITYDLVHVLWRRPDRIRRIS